MTSDIAPSQRLRELAEQARSYQLERQWTDAQICREIAHLGSTKTFKRILDPGDPLDELSVEAQLRSYETAMELIDSRRAKDLPVEIEYDDFRNVVAVRQAVAMALREEGKQTFVCVEGENGCGKDAALNSLLKRWPKLIVPVEATELWRDSLALPLADIINSLGVKRRRDEGGDLFRLPHFPAQRWEIVREELNRRKRVLAINEYHHLGPRAINLTKSIINQTPSVVVGFFIPVLLDRVIKDGFQEAAQLFGNRLCKRVHLESPAPDEILLLFERRGITFDSAFTANELAKSVADKAPSFGNWAFVKRVSRKFILGLNGIPVPLDKGVDCLASATSDCISHRKPGQ